MFRKKLKKYLAFATTCLLSASLFSNLTLAATTPDYLPEDRPIQQPLKDQTQRKIVGYFPAWAYNEERNVQADYMVTDLQWDDLTHIQYAFCVVGSDNKISFGDASGEKAAIGEDFSQWILENGPIMHDGKEVQLDPTLPYKGHFNLLQVMKKQHPDVKLLVSIGGWAGSRGFYSMVSTESGRETFANSCVDFIRKYGFDGVDIDFEYPTSLVDAGNPDDFATASPYRATVNANYNKMMRTLRQKLDAASIADGKYYMQTAAVPASAWVLGGMPDQSFAKYLDFLSVMSYDFHGSWNGYVENLANIYSDPNDTEVKGQARSYLSMEWAYNYYRGVLPSEKILMGIPYYTRGWEKVNKNGNPTGLHGTSIKTKITETGWGASGDCNIWGDDDDHDGIVDPSGSNPLWHVLNLMDRDSNYQLHWDNAGKVPYIWNEQRATFLSFENEQSIDERVKFVDNKNLGGVLIWVMNGDYGLNPNYVPGSTNIHEGKYTVGDTLTKRLSSGFKRIGDATISPDLGAGLPEVAVGVDFVDKYDHPFGDFSFKITNYSNEDIPGGWTFSFDVPDSAEVLSIYGVEYTKKPNGALNTFTVKSPGWMTIKANGGSASFDGRHALLFSDITNLRFNNSIPVGNKAITPEVKVPTITSSVASTDTGAYTITATIPANSNATSYTLYENNQAVKTGAVTTAAQTVTFEAKDQAIGTYIYKITLTDGKATKEATTSVQVVKKQLKPATITSSVASTPTGTYTITATIPAQSNATSYSLYEDNQVVKTGAVTETAQTVTFDVTDKAIGTYTYKITLTNGTDVVENTVIVKVVKADELATATVSLSETSTNADAYKVYISVPANSQATKVTLYEGQKAIFESPIVPNAVTATELSHLVSNNPVGKYTYHAILTDGTKATTSNTATIEVTAKPVDNTVLAPSISINPTVSTTGKYTVTATIPANSKATNYTLYESSSAIAQGVVTEQAQSIVKEFLDKANGTYTYKIELTNSVDSKNATASVEVKKEDVKPGVKPAIPALTHNNWDQKPNYTINFNMWWGENGTSWKLYEDDKLIHEAPLTANGQNAQSGSYDLKDKTPGTYTYKVELINAAGGTFSNTINVIVKATQSDNNNGSNNGNNGGDNGNTTPATNKPATPALTHNNWDQKANYTVTFNMWWGENGTSWKLYENNAFIHEAPLTANGQNAQSGSYDITSKAPGTYIYKVELINAAGSTFSNETTVTVR